MPALAATTSLAGPAARTGEWRRGIGRLLDDPPPLLADYIALVQSLGLYPGSPRDRACAAAPRRPPGLLRTASRGCGQPAAPLRWGHPGRGASSRCLGGAWRAAAAQGATRPRADRPAVRGPTGIRRPGPRPRHRLAALPHRCVRRLVSDQAARPGAAVPCRHETERCARHRDRPSCACASRSIRRGSMAAACWWSIRRIASSRRCRRS